MSSSFDGATSRAIGRVPERAHPLHQRRSNHRTSTRPARRSRSSAHTTSTLSLRHLGADAKAQAEDRRAEELGDDGADQRQRRVDLERVEHERQRRRQAQLEEASACSWRRTSASGRAAWRRRRPVRRACSRASGKKVTTTITAAFDCQSNPNHITMIGAMPTMGMALSRLPQRQQPALEERDPVDRTAIRKPQPTPGEAGEHRLEKGLAEIRPEHRRLGHDAAPPARATAAGPAARRTPPPTCQR